MCHFHDWLQQRPWSLTDWSILELFFFCCQEGREYRFESFLGHPTEEDPVQSAKDSIIKAVYLFRLQHKRTAGKYLQNTILTSARILEEVKHNTLKSSSKEMHLFWTHFSRWPWVTDPDPGSCTFCQMVLRVTCKKNRYAAFLLKKSVHSVSKETHCGELPFFWESV